MASSGTKIELWPWQKKAMNAINSTLTKSGIIIAATGGGKSFIMYKLIEDNPTEKFLIVVPTQVLQKQHYDNLLRFGVVDKLDISLIGNGHKDVPETRVTIAVVNSLRSVNWSHPHSMFDWVLMDEVHRYCSPKNCTFLKNPNFNHRLGFTATLERPDRAEQMLYDLIGPILYRLTNADSLANGYISNYEIEVVPCMMNQIELSRYTMVNDKVKSLMQLFNNNYDSAKQIMRQGYRNPMFRYAVELVRAVQERKAVLTRIDTKKDRAVQIVMDNPDKKILLFDEIQESANVIYKKLIDLGVSCVLYHSGMGKKDRENSISKFRSGEANVICSVRALDEGLDVKSAEVGIIVNGNSQKRQVLQRLGRILRKDGDKLARLVMLFVPGTTEERYMTRRMRHIGAEANTISENEYGEEEEA